MNEESKSCECQTWVRLVMLDTPHNPSCPKYEPLVVERTTYTLIRDLLQGIRNWASDEDGVHPECCDAYNAAASFIVQPPLTEDPLDTFDDGKTTDAVKILHNRYITTPAREASLQAARGEARQEREDYARLKALAIPSTLEVVMNIFKWYTTETARLLKDHQPIPPALATMGRLLSYIGDLTKTRDQVTARLAWNAVHFACARLVLLEIFSDSPASEYYGLGPIAAIRNAIIVDTESQLEEARQKIAELEKELKVSDQLLTDHERLLHAIPECGAHGPCIPHAVEWIEQAKTDRTRIAELEERAFVLNYKYETTRDLQGHTIQHNNSKIADLRTRNDTLEDKNTYLAGSLSRLRLAGYEVSRNLSKALGRINAAAEHLLAIPLIEANTTISTPEQRALEILKPGPGSDVAPAPPPTDVAEIIKRWLEVNGFDGLYCEGGVCGCELSDLVPGGQECMVFDCEPAHKGPCNPDTCDNDGDCQWHMYPGPKEEVSATEPTETTEKEA